MTEIKKTAKSRTTPRQIRRLPQKAISWELTPNFDKLQITFIDEKAYFKNLPLNDLTLSIYAWDSAPKHAYANFELSKKLEYPLELNLKNKRFTNIVGRPYFRIRIFDNQSKAIVCQTKTFLMTLSSNLGSLLPMTVSSLGPRIARIEIDPEEGPSIQLSNNFSTESGIVPLDMLKNTALNDPVFACSFWPAALEQILVSALENINEDWSQKWLLLAHELAPGHFTLSSGDRVVPIEKQSFYSVVIPVVINSWIERYHYDQKFYHHIFEENQ